ncbi:hypothetical protein [Xylophilus sp. GOD-11R]|uniref:hypothetical protein n=1 Tax=Xylophilus sp. GOD-11R TaxID=3089814 RepID=UPI00298C7F87|nr:hypothetical protein [Xylophilus sp. GOD-11R]WPB58293.1 hypothetical protein R9X41_06525 [Xylophilus sp. GOD-11R]
MSLTGHFFSPAVFVMAPRSCDKLSAAGKVAFLAMREYIRYADARGVDQMRKDGMQVVTNVDKQKVQAAFQPAYVEYARKYGRANIDATKAVGAAR